MPDVHDIGDDVDMSIGCLGIFVFIIFLSLVFCIYIFCFIGYFSILILLFIFYYVFLKIRLFIENQNFIFSFKNIEIKIIKKNALTKPINSRKFKN